MGGVRFGASSQDAMADWWHQLDSWYITLRHEFPRYSVSFLSSGHVEWPPMPVSNSFDAASPNYLEGVLWSMIPVGVLPALIWLVVPLLVLITLCICYCARHDTSSRQLRRRGAAAESDDGGDDERTPLQAGVRRNACSAAQLFGRIVSCVAALLTAALVGGAIALSLEADKSVNSFWDATLLPLSEQTNATSALAADGLVMLAERNVTEAPPSSALRAAASRVSWYGDMTVSTLRTARVSAGLAEHLRLLALHIGALVLLCSVLPALIGPWTTKPWRSSCLCWMTGLGLWIAAALLVFGRSVTFADSMAVVDLCVAFRGVTVAGNFSSAPALTSLLPCNGLGNTTGPLGLENALGALRSSASATALRCAERQAAYEVQCNHSAAAVTDASCDELLAALQQCRDDQRSETAALVPLSLIIQCNATWDAAKPLGDNACGSDGALGWADLTLVLLGAAVALLVIVLIPLHFGVRRCTRASPAPEPPSYTPRPRGLSPPPSQDGSQRRSASFTGSGAGGVGSGLRFDLAAVSGGPEMFPTTAGGGPIAGGGGSGILDARKSSGRLPRFPNASGAEGPMSPHDRASRERIERAAASLESPFHESGGAYAPVGSHASSARLGSLSQVPALPLWAAGSSGGSSAPGYSDRRSQRLV